MACWYRYRDFVEAIASRIHSARELLFAVSHDPVFACRFLRGFTAQFWRIPVTRCCATAVMIINEAELIIAECAAARLDLSML